MIQKLFVVAFILMVNSHANAQAAELDNFISSTKSYIEFRSQPSKNPKNYQKLNDAELKKLNQSMINYARSIKGKFDESNGYVSLQSNKANKLLKASNFLELNVWSFDLNGVKFSFLAYNILNGYAEQKNFIIINEMNGKPVFTGNNEGCYIDWINALDENHVILSLHQGDLGKSRKVMVLHTASSTWKPTKAFQGTNTKEQTRFYFNLESTFEDLLSLPQNANQVFLDTSSKALYYFQHIENKKKKVNAIWKNKVFLLDDYTIPTEFNMYQPVPVAR